MTSATDTPKRRGPLFWVLTGGVIFLALLFGGLFLLAMISARQQRTPSDQDYVNMHRMMSPDDEILEENPQLHIIHLRNKKTGEEFLMTADLTTHQIKKVPYKVEQPEKTPSK